MPVFPSYERDQGLDFGRTPQVDTGSGAVVAGMKQLAAGVGEAGAYAEQYQQRERQKAAYNTGLSFEQLNAKLANQHQELVDNQTPGAEGLAAQGAEATQKASLEWLKTVPPELQQEYAQKIGILTEKYHGAYAASEHAGRNAWEKETTLTQIPTDQNQAVANPKTVDDVVKNRLARIDQTTLPPAEKLALKTMAEKEIRKSVVLAQPEAEAAKTLGQPGYDTHGAVPKIAPNASTAAREAVAMGYFTGRGYSKAQAAGIVGNLIQESSLNPDAPNRGDGADGSDSIGIGQWNGSRAVALKQFAASQGKPVTDFGVQLAFLDHELSTQYAGTKAKLMAAKTPDEAAGVIVTGYEKPKGSNYGVLAADGWGRRRDSARRLAGGDYAPADQTGSVAETPAGTPDPRYNIFTPEERQSMFNSVRTMANQQQAIAKSNLEPQLQDAQSALMATGHYDGPPITREKFDAAYGPEEGGQKFAQFERVQAVGQKVDAMKLTPDAENTALVNAAKPIDSGPGFAQKQAEYEALGQAQAAIAKARKEDPAGWSIGVAPQLGAMFKDQSPEGFQKALLAMGAFQTKVGIKPEDQQLMPKAQAKGTVDAFKNADAPTDKRIGAVIGTVLATKDPAQQRVIFQQLVKEGLPAASEGAVEAFAAGRPGDGNTLMNALLTDPAKLPKATAASPANIEAEIQTNYHDVLDAAYGLRLGRPSNGDRAINGQDLMIKAAQVNIAGGDDIPTAVKKAVDNMYGKGYQVLKRTDQGMAASVLVTAGQDPREVGRKLDASLGQVVSNLEDIIRAHNEEKFAGKPGALAIAQADAANQARNVFAQGNWVNLNGGYAFADPYTNGPVPGKDGKPFVVKFDPSAPAAVEAPAPAAASPQPAAPAPALRWDGMPDTGPIVPQAAPPPTRDIKPPPPTEKSPAQDISQLGRDIRKAGIGGVPALGFGTSPKWPGGQ